MENASKALIMAGGVLISLLVISLLVFFFNSIRSWQGTGMAVEQEERDAEFNKQYEVYERDLYGSELLSLAQKIADYNKRESDSKGYQKIEIRVKLIDNPEGTIFTKGKDAEYNAEELQNAINSIDDMIKPYSKRDELNNPYLFKSKDGKYERTISQLATMRTDDIYDILQLEESNPNDKTTYKKIQSYIAEYNKYKNLLSDIKQRKFKFINSGYEIYDKNNGRIKLLKYELRKQQI